MIETNEKVAPRRIQRKRVRGWRKPQGALNVARPSIWGNPYRHKNPHRAKILFRHLLLGDPTHLPYALRARRDKMMVNLISLRNEDLMCFCRLDRPCHADVLLEAANGDDFPAIDERINFAALLDLFKGGESFDELAARFGTTPAHVQEIVRWWMTTKPCLTPSAEPHL